ncbi:hypothetical protein AwWohl_05300 [Gammaproteobacteria bacterium]|nr:hypothetical protein AwWohl_05300 [Gammaproteobacteria bacterium]
MKSFLYGFSGSILAIVIYLYGSSQYSDYRSRVQTYSWINQLLPIQNLISEKIIAKQLSNDFLKKIVFPASLSQNAITLFQVSSEGVITIKGGYDGQIIILYPVLSDDKVIWACIGGSTRSVPKACNQGENFSERFTKQLTNKN